MTCQTEDIPHCLGIGACPSGCIPQGFQVPCRATASGCPSRTCASVNFLLEAEQSGYRFVLASWEVAQSTEGLDIGFSVKGLKSETPTWITITDTCANEVLFCAESVLQFC